MSTIFYSQVNGALQRELNKRGAAGSTSRTNKDMQFMIEKIANVQLEAYDDTPVADSKPIAGFGILGGHAMQIDSHLPSGETGFLNDNIRPSRRTTPGIMDVNISINDQSKSYINKASVTILIPDATTDMDEMERIYCAPGRHIQLKIIHPESTILSGELLDAQALPNTDTLRKFYPNIDLERLRKMNELYFQGRISNFTFSYNAEGSVELTIEIIGTSNTYAEVKLNMSSTVQTALTGSGGKAVENQVSDLYTSLSRQIDDVIQAYKSESNDSPEFEQLAPNTTDQGILVGTPYILGNSNSPKLIRMVSLGYLINYINTFALERVGARITCNDAICFSNFYEKMVSSNPMKVLLWSGTTGIKTNEYTFDISTTAPTDAYNIAPSETVPEPPAIGPIATEPPPVLKMFPKVQAESPGFAITSATENVSFPSRIYINLETLKNIIDIILLPDKNGVVDASVRNFLNKLSDVIRINTGNAINLVLVQDPIISSALIYCDANYVSSTASVTEFTLPIFTSKTGASVVRNFSLTSNVPNSVKNMIFGLTSGDTSTQKQVAYNPYIYANSETRIKLAQEWKTKHEQVIKDLASIKNTFSKRPEDQKNIEILQSTLERYITYFTPDINQSIERTKAIFPMELEFTIDGINGFKYGDVLSFAGLPARYTRSFVFTVLGITHSVASNGEWTTTVKCNPRVRIIK